MQEIKLDLETRMQEFKGRGQDRGLESGFGSRIGTELGTKD